MRARFAPVPLPASASAALTVSVNGQVVRAEIWGQPLFFTVVNPQDTIQKHHAAGAFYEPEELDIIRRWCPMGAVFVDIGANVGNHALFAAKFLQPARVILFEPNPDAVAILQSNLGLNGVLGVCDLSHLGIGLSDQSRDGLSMRARPMNLGGGKISEEAGDVSLRRGDDFLLDAAPDFIKIDVEGMEMQVLSGLQQTIDRHRPTLFVEVDNENRTTFDAWVEANRYVSRASHRRYKANENLLLVPRAQKRAVPTT